MQHGHRMELRYPQPRQQRGGRTGTRGHQRRLAAERAVLGGADGVRAHRGDPHARVYRVRRQRGGQQLHSGLLPPGRYAQTAAGEAAQGQIGDPAGGGQRGVRQQRGEQRTHQRLRGPGRQPACGQRLAGRQFGPRQQALGRHRGEPVQGGAEPDEAQRVGHVGPAPRSCERAGGGECAPSAPCAPRAPVEQHRTAGPRRRTATLRRPGRHPVGAALRVQQRPRRERAQREPLQGRQPGERLRVPVQAEHTRTPVQPEALDTVGPRPAPRRAAPPPGPGRAAPRRSAGAPRPVRPVPLRRSPRPRSWPCPALHLLVAGPGPGACVCAADQHVSSRRRRAYEPMGLPSHCCLFSCCAAVRLCCCAVAVRWCCCCAALLLPCGGACVRLCVSASVCVRVRVPRVLPAAAVRAGVRACAGAFRPVRVRGSLCCCGRRLPS